MTNPFKKEKHPVDYTNFVRNHSMCMKLALMYMQDIADKTMLEQDKVDFSEQLRKYQKNDPMITGFTGGTWIKWMLNDLVPGHMKREEENVSTG